MEILIALIMAAIALALMRLCFVQGREIGAIETKLDVKSELRDKADEKWKWWYSATDLQRGDWTAATIASYAQGLRDAANYTSEVERGKPKA